MLIRDILRKKGGNVVTIEARCTVNDAISKLNEHGIGALIVTGEDGQVGGIVTERDILHECGKWWTQGDQATPSTLVQEVMTKDVVIGVPDDHLDYVMGIMTKNRIRHLPILEDGKLAGVISIGDVVNAHLKAMEFENRMLKDYIHGIVR